MGGSIVVAFRMSPTGVGPGPEGGYLARARGLCVRAQALGARLVAWSATLLAFAWDAGSIEDAVLVAASIREEALSRDRAWASGISEGDLEPVDLDGQVGSLAWGPALLAAASLARLAKPGEVVVDAQLSALRAGRLAVVEERAPADGERLRDPDRLRGWRLDLEHPWKDAHAAPSGDESRPNGALAERIRMLARGDETAAAVDALARLRRARARAEGGPPSARCQAALALGMTLSLAGRCEEALLEALDALARAKEANDPKAIGACMALLAKLYASAGLAHAAVALRDGAGV